MNSIKTIKIDQIRFTVPIKQEYLKASEEPDVIRAVNRYFKFRLLFDKPIRKLTGKNGYTNSILWGAGEQGGIIAVMYNPNRVDMGVLIDFTSTGKILYESLCKVNNLDANWRKIITAIYQRFGGHTTRIDIAIDLINKGYSVNDIYKHLKSGNYVFINPVNQRINFKRIQHIGRSNEVNTIYVGSRYSDSYLRIYDKKLEQMSKKGIFHSLANRCNDWVRVEGEFKNRECHNIGAMVSNLPTDNIEPYLASYVNKHWRLVFNHD
ncbi:replication initiation factor domain-containing protein [Lactobacillus taiwanensis]|uniref:replication initiation factor domain-containing protein n=1 Tax=Lactobacillus taiwanensis TaxID=508451 RepID=UPI00242FD27B|nr:replication initiation factor domain-containing protein [Lactobacillus taiwanensis]